MWLTVEVQGLRDLCYKPTEPFTSLFEEAWMHVRRAGVGIDKVRLDCCLQVALYS